MSWRFFPTFLLRATGLPLEALRAVTDAAAGSGARLEAERRALFEVLAEPTMREIRYLDKLIDELAKGKAMEKILRK